MCNWGFEQSLIRLVTSSMEAAGTSSLWTPSKRSFELP